MAKNKTCARSILSVRTFQLKHGHVLLKTIGLFSSSLKCTEFGCQFVL